MLSLQRCRELLTGEDRTISDEELEAECQRLYTFGRCLARAALSGQRFAQATKRLREEERADIEERAAIAEFDGRLSREQAERLALSPYRRRLPKA